MKESLSIKNFERYNKPLGPDSEDLPESRKSLRENLDMYTKAATNLYGAIEPRKLAAIYNKYNKIRVEPEEIRELLMPLILENKDYCFYKDYIVTGFTIDDFDYIEMVIRHHEDLQPVPPYEPVKAEFLKYADPYYQDKREKKLWDELYELMDETFPDSPRMEIWFGRLWFAGKYEEKASGYLEVFENLPHRSLKQKMKMLGVLNEACNSLRLHRHKGHTSVEAAELISKVLPRDALRTFQKTEMDDPCPCGSGKKYWECCRAIENAKTAQLSKEDCQLFFETWYGLLGYVNRTKHVLKVDLKPIYPNVLADAQYLEIRKYLEAEPSLIADYISVCDVSEEKLEILKSWRDIYKTSMGIMLEHRPEHSVAAFDFEGTLKLYGIKGLSMALSLAAPRKLPYVIETVLLPFKDVIIYDTFIQAQPAFERMKIDRDQEVITNPGCLAMICASD